MKPNRNRIARSRVFAKEAAQLGALLARRRQPIPAPIQQRKKQP